jgi:RHS repeat-associated protein
VARIEVFNQQSLMWRYDLAYESYTDAFGLSRLASVQKIGRDGKTPDAIRFSFNYSGSTPNVLPQVVSLGSVGVDFSVGHADLIDINGDALPDVVDTTRGQHRFYFNTLQSGRQIFSAPVASRVAPNGSMDLASQYVEMADIDGDGHADMIDVVNNQILWNKGTGDWSSRTTLSGTTSLRNLFDTGFINFTDYDGDKAIDLISTAANGYVFYYVGLGGGNSVDGDPLGSNFAHDVKFADINGDGLQDVVRYVNGNLFYKLSLGFGAWSTTHEMSDLPAHLDESDIHFADINGDALSDVVVLAGASDTSEIQTFINQNTTKFLSFPIRPDRASLPDLHNISVRFADMNGNGTIDIVFIDSSGDLSFLDLFGLRPNLLTGISSNIGMQSTFTYGSSVHHGVKDLPFPSITLDSVKTLALSTSTAKEQHLSFSDGFYDSVEHQFRGYKNVTVVVLGDAHTDVGMEVSYDDVLNLVTSSSDWFLSTSDARNVTTYGYDTLGRLGSITRPGDKSVTETYDYFLASPLNRLVKRTRSGGSVDLEENICFDGLGRKRQTLSKVSGNVYQSDGFIEANFLGKPAKTYQPFAASSGDCVASANARFSETSYDALGRETKTVFPDADGSFTSTTYEPLLTYAFDPEDNNSQSSYANTPSRTRKDGLDRVIEISRSLTPNNFETLFFAYDELGRLSEMTGPTGYHKIQTYDLLGRVLSVQDDDTGTTSFEYDTVGNVLSRTDARGAKTVFEYDAANRLLRKYEAGKRADTLVEYVYDTCTVASCTNGAGRLVQTSYPIRQDLRGTDTFGYDARGQKIYLARSIEGHTYEFNTTYDNAGRLIQTEYPMGKIIAQQFDGLGRVISVPGYLSNIEYNEQALLSHIARQNGASDSRSHDDLLRLSSLYVQSSSASALDLDYVRDRVGNIVEIKNSILSDKPSANAVYTYDAHYRLIQAHLDAGHKFDETIATTFDPGDNILSKTSTLGVKSKEHMGNYQYQRAHLAVQAGDKKYSYDVAGNMLTVNDQSYVWDNCGQMTQAYVNNALAQTLSYDAEGKRVVKRENNKTTLYLSDDCELRDDMFVTYVLLDGQRLVKITHVDLAGWNLPDLGPVKNNTIKGDGKITGYDAWVAYAYSHHEINLTNPPTDVTDYAALVQPLRKAAANRALYKNADNDDARVEHLHHNHLDTLAVITDARGEVTERFDHYPWGSPRFMSENYLEDYSFTGQERDEVTGLSHHGVRLLDTSLPRWTSADPLFETLGEETMKRPWEAASRYLYASGDPINALDSSGRVTIIVHGTLLSGAKAQWAKPGSSFSKAVEKTFSETPVDFSWSGGNNPNARTAAANQLAKFINSPKIMARLLAGEKLNIVAHSHGGNVVKMYTNMVEARFIDTLVNLGTPQRGDYEIDRGKVGRYVNASSEFDQVQVNGGGHGSWLPMASDRVDRKAQNIDIETSKSPIESHSDLHTPAAWVQVDAALKQP